MRTGSVADVCKPLSIAKPREEFAILGRLVSHSEENRPLLTAIQAAQLGRRFSSNSLLRLRYQELSRSRKIVVWLVRTRRNDAASRPYNPRSHLL